MCETTRVFSGDEKAEHLYLLIEQYAAWFVQYNINEDNQCCIDVSSSESLATKANTTLAKIELLNFISSEFKQKYEINENLFVSWLKK